MASQPFGSTSAFARVEEGVLLKYPRQVPRETRAYRDIDNNFAVEIQILNALQTHPRIVRCFGQNEEKGDPRGILLAEANQGDLQRYLDNRWNEISPRLLQLWCLQVVEAVAYIHDCGVIHSDLRPENFLVHEIELGHSELWLCDFGGSTCIKLGLDGGHLPDSGFFDPRSEWISTPKTDIFSIASILYTILTGHWPYREARPFTSIKEMDGYGRKVDAMFEQGRFPNVDGLFAGSVIMKCWNGEYSRAEDVLKDLRSCMPCN